MGYDGPLNHSRSHMPGVAISQHVFAQMADTSNIASGWHQLAIHKLADWTKLHVLILLLFRLSCMTKNEIFAQMLLLQVKQQNKMCVVGKFLYG